MNEAQAWTMTAGLLTIILEGRVESLDRDVRAIARRLVDGPDA